MGKLSVKMFGGFSASYGDEVLIFGKQRNSKFCQLFQLLMTRPGQGFSKEKIAESLYGGEEVEDINASLNNTIFRLRKYFRESPLPPGEYLKLAGGVLSLNGDIEMESDVGEFERIVRAFEQEQDKQAKAELCKMAGKLYKGEFLPKLSSEQWVIEKSRSYQAQYSEMMEYLIQCLRDEGDYESAEKIAVRGERVCPYERWKLWQVDSLVALGRHKEAEAIYREVAARVQEAGGFLSKKTQTWFHKIGERILRQEESDAEIGRFLMEEIQAEGAYACTLPSFCDCFRMLKRTLARGELCFILCLCTVLDSNGHPAKGRQNGERQDKKLHASFQTCLRRGDIYAKYSDSQYLLLCIGAERESVRELGTRIDMEFRRRCGGRGGIQCAFLDDGSVW